MKSDFNYIKYFTKLIMMIFIGVSFSFYGRAVISDTKPIAKFILLLCGAFGFIVYDIVMDDKK